LLPQQRKHKIKKMGLFRTIVISAAIYGAYKFLTETDDLGRSKLDNIKEQAPEWLEKARAVKDDIKNGQLPEGI
jgi:hypothetical protein